MVARFDAPRAIHFWDKPFFGLPTDKIVSYIHEYVRHRCTHNDDADDDLHVYTWERHTYKSDMIHNTFLYNII